MSTTALVVDETNADRGWSNAMAINSCVRDTYFYDGYHKLKVPERSLESSIPDQIALLVLHDTDSSFWKELKCVAEVEIRYTGDCPVSPPRANEIWVARHITGREPLTQEEACDIAYWAREQDVSRLPSILRFGHSKAFLSALSILCQGYLAALCHAGATGDSDYVRALDVMGWDNIKGSDILTPLAEKVAAVQRTEWWKDVLKKEGTEVRKILAAEMQVGTVPEDSKLSVLVEAIYKDSPVTDHDLVAGAFLEIVDALR